jgi:ATP-dependent DNA ligase
MTALAGCVSGVSSEMGETSEKDVLDPAVKAGDQWQLETPESAPRVFETGTVLTVDWAAVGQTNRYEHVIVRNRLREETFKKIEYEQWQASTTPPWGR